MLEDPEPLPDTPPANRQTEHTVDVPPATLAPATRKYRKRGTYKLGLPFPRYRERRAVAAPGPMWTQACVPARETARGLPMR